ncbi:MAG: hypothetical protein QN194_15900 [Armatimonadota bacterium]|nr:hypothetical protein [Armatimonadota bacterium]
MVTGASITMDPFEMEEYATFTDAILVQYVSDPARLRWAGGGGGGGFFVEADAAPSGEFAPAILVTRDGREVAGFAARRIRVYPVAIRSRWEQGEPEARRVVGAYRPGARSHTQMLAILPGGTWVLITARGLASKALARAFREHARFVAARFRSAAGRPYAPFAAILELAAGRPARAGSSVITPLERVITDRPEPAPVELGRAIRRRWPEVQAWRAEWGGGEEPGEEAGNGKVPAPEESAEPVPELPAEIPASSPEPPARPGPAEAPQDAGSAPGDAPGAGLEAEAGLAFLLGQAWPLARPRLTRAFPELAAAATASEAAAMLAQARPGASFWSRTGQAIELYLAWTERIPALRRAAPARYRALKEHLKIGAAWGQDADEPGELAAMAALAWLFRPGERRALERLLGPDPDLPDPE